MPKPSSASGSESPTSTPIANIPSTATSLNSAAAAEFKKELEHKFVASGLSEHASNPEVMGTTVKLDTKQNLDNSKASKIAKITHEPIDVQCMLLQDTSPERAPLHLQQLLQHTQDLKCMPGELLFLLLYLIALEAGFVNQKNIAACCGDMDELTATNSFSVNNVIRLTRTLPEYTHDEDKTYFRMELGLLVNVSPPKEKTFYSQLTALVSGDLLIVTLSPDAACMELRGFSICLSILRYVHGQSPKNKPLQARFQKLDELSRLTREGLLVPMRNQQLALGGLGVFPSLAGLPAELYDSIIKNLNKNQRNILANVNTYLRDMVRSSAPRLALQERSVPVVNVASADTIVLGRLFPLVEFHSDII